MNFRLTYAGELPSGQARGRNGLIHGMRRRFHTQLKTLWATHPAVVRFDEAIKKGEPSIMKIEEAHGFRWLPMVTKYNGLVAKIDVLMLRIGHPGEAFADIDKRLKIIVDALRKADQENQLIEKENDQTLKFYPKKDENPFHVLLEDDKLITDISVATDMLLEPVDGAISNSVVRLVLNVSVISYNPTMDNLQFV